MASITDHWREWATRLPAWICPRCNEGRLKIKENTLIDAPTASTKAGRLSEEWVPDWDEGVFVAILTCDNAPCAEAVTVAGNTSVDVDFDQEGQPFLTTHYKILSVFPSPLPIIVPSHTPDGVKAALVVAAGLLWATPDAAMNKLRQAIEAFLSAEKVPGTMTKKSGGRVRLSLHERIARYGETPKGKGLASALLAAKWLGNAGSHEDGSASVNRDDVLLAFQVVEHVLEERYSDRRQALLRKITAVNKKKGPVRPIKRQRRVKPPF